MEDLNKQLLDAIKTNDIELVKKLIQEGADVNKAGEGGWTPLHKACHWWCSNIVEILIGAGADVNKVDDGGWTPLSIISGDKHCVETSTMIAKMLISAGADVNLSDNSGRIPLHHAIEWGGGVVEMVGLLIDRGANVNKADNKGVTPLNLAISCKRDKMIELLKLHGAKL